MGFNYHSAITNQQCRWFVRYSCRVSDMRRLRTHESCTKTLLLVQNSHMSHLILIVSTYHLGPGWSLSHDVHHQYHRSSSFSFSYVFMISIKPWILESVLLDAQFLRRPVTFELQNDGRILNLSPNNLTLTPENVSTRRGGRNARFERIYTWTCYDPLNTLLLYCYYFYWTHNTPIYPIYYHISIASIIAGVIVIII